MPRRTVLAQATAAAERKVAPEPTPTPQPGGSAKSKNFFKDDAAPSVYHVQKEHRPDDLQQIDFYQFVENKKEHRNPYVHLHGLEHPYIRFLICGPSGSRKTTLALNIIHKCACFDNVIVFTGGTPEEPLYQWLGKAFHGNFMITTKVADLPVFQEDDAQRTKKQTFIIFDDCITLPSKILDSITQYFIFGRKANASCAFLSHNYFSTPKKIRQQCNRIAIMLNDNPQDLRLIAKNIAGDAKGLEAMYKACRKKDSFFWIDLKAPLKLRYREGWTGVFENPAAEDSSDDEE